MHTQKKGLIIALVSILLVIFATFSILFIVIRKQLSSSKHTSQAQTIDILRIEGEIGPSTGSSFSAPAYDHAFVLETLDELIENPNSQGLILFLDTPGGAIYHTDEVYLKLLEYKETGRPIYASFGSMAASGGYYLASAADVIVANRNTLTGSIGVIMSAAIDISEFLENHGINVQMLTAGENKGMGNIYEPMTEEQLEIYRSILTEAHEQFIDVVATGRGLTLDETRKLADGRLFTAKQALSIGLVDELGTLEDTIDQMMEDYQLLDAEVNYLEPTYSYSFFDLFLKAETLLKGSTPMDEILSLQNQINKVGYYSTSPLLQR